MKKETVLAAMRIIRANCEDCISLKIDDNCKVCPLHFNHPEMGATCIFDYMGIPPHTWIDNSEEELPLITEDILQEIYDIMSDPLRLVEDLR